MLTFIPWLVNISVVPYILLLLFIRPFFWGRGGGWLPFFPLVGFFGRRTKICPSYHVLFVLLSVRLLCVFSIDVCAIFVCIFIYLSTLVESKLEYTFTIIPSPFFFIHSAPIPRYTLIQLFTLFTNNIYSIYAMSTSV